MNIIETKELTATQKEQIYSIWNEEAPEALTHRNLNAFHAHLDDMHQKLHIIIIGEHDKVTGWLLLFERGGQNWLVILLGNKMQRKGLGSMLLERIKLQADELNVWVIDHDTDHRLDGAVYHSPLLFYTKNGFKIIASQRQENARMSAVKMVWQKEY